MLRQAEVAKVERAQLGPPATQLSEQPCGAAGRCPARHGVVVSLSWLMMTSIGSFVVVRGHQCCRDALRACRDSRASRCEGINRCGARASVLQRCEGIGSVVEMVRGHQCRDARACSARASVQRCEGIGYFVDDECRFDERRFDAHLMRNKVTLR